MQNPKNISPDDARRAEAEAATKSIQKTQLDTRKREKELHIKTLERELRELRDKIHEDERKRTNLVAQQGAIEQEEKKAKDKLQQVSGTAVRGKTESQGVATRLKTFKTQLAELTKKKEEFAKTLTELGQKTVGKTSTGSQKGIQEKFELERQLGVLEKEIETLTASIRADEAHLNEEKATFSREKTELEQIKQKLTKTTNATQEDTRNKDALKIEEKKREADTKKTETLLRSVEGEILKVTNELESVTRQEQMQKATLQKSGTEEESTKQEIITAKNKLFATTHPLTALDAKLSTQKVDEAKKEAELRTAEKELSTLK